ncbi:MAG: acyl-ACP--UDP-N-acetylglucosamine O-acyltransferase [Alphaproteobacteria bacterium]
MIHPTAIIEDGAQIGKNVEIGAYSCIGASVDLHDNVKIHSHVVVGGETVVGEGTEIFPFASIGLIPQDLKYHGEASTLIIGKNNVIREHVTMNPGTESDNMVTKVGDNCLFMIGVHIAHDCVVGNNVIMANNAAIAGHVIVEDFAIIGGFSAVQQFVRIGAHAMIGGMSAVDSDVIPFGLMMGERANLQGLNLVGLKRRDFTKDEMSNLRAAYKEIFSKEGALSERVAKVKSLFADNVLVMEVVRFLEFDSKRKISQPSDNG